MATREVATTSLSPEERHRLELEAKLRVKEQLLVTAQSNPRFAHDASILGEDCRKIQEKLDALESPQRTRGRLFRLGSRVTGIAHMPEA